MRLTLEKLLAASDDGSFDDGILLNAVLEPLGGPGDTVKPAIYVEAVFQADRRWASTDDTKAQDVFVIDNVPSQANRLEEALRRSRAATGVPELLLDLSGVPGLPPHLPRQLSSWQFPHRNADAYLRDSILEGKAFLKHRIGQRLFAATASDAAELMSWFPQALLYGFWQSHLGKKGSQAKHARAWTSEIIGWQPATPKTKIHGVKGDPLNLSIDETAIYNDQDHTQWNLGTKKGKGEVKKKLSELGHGQVPFGNETPAAISFRRVTQRATVSFAQLRRVELGPDYGTEANAAARALLVAMGLHAHTLAFGRGFALRSGANLRVSTSAATWLGAKGDEPLESLQAGLTAYLLKQAKEHAKSARVPLDGWDADSLTLKPRSNLERAIKSSWPLAQAH